MAAHIDTVPLNNVFFYQAYDPDGIIMGLLATTLPPEEIEELEAQWKEHFYTLADEDQDPDPTLDGFVEFLLGNGYPAKRIFCEADIITP